MVHSPHPLHLASLISILGITMYPLILIMTDSYNNELKLSDMACLSQYFCYLPIILFLFLILLVYPVK